MADSKRSGRSSQSDDPTIRSGTAVDEYPEGTHPARSVSEVTHSATNLKYEDMPDDQKPDPTTVAQVQVLQGAEAGAFGRSDEG